MKKSVLTITTLCLCALCDVQAQIDNRYHWYDGEITYTATHLEHSNVRMNAMDEGEELEFILRYDNEVNPEHQVYTVLKGGHDITTARNAGLTAHRQKAEGLDVICIYDCDGLLKTVMVGQKEWDAEKLNKNLWMEQTKGRYSAKGTGNGKKVIDWDMEELSIDGIVYPYELYCFNGRATGFIRVDEVPGEPNELEGTWQVVPTLEGLHLYSVNTETAISPWGWERDGREYILTRTDLKSGRFDYASRTLLNDMQFRHLDKKALRIMRNEILARHGYRFKSKDLQEYFGKQTWYKPLKDNSKIRLSFITQLNVELIKYAEAQPEQPEQ
jgi:hypothetical protein